MGAEVAGTKAVGEVEAVEAELRSGEEAVGGVGTTVGGAVDVSSRSGAEWKGRGSVEEEGREVEEEVGGKEEEAGEGKSELEAEGMKTIWIGGTRGEAEEVEEVLTRIMGLEGAAVLGLAGAKTG